LTCGGAVGGGTASSSIEDAVMAVIPLSAESALARCWLCVDDRSGLEKLRGFG